MKDVHEHAWRWFEVCASQRMEMMNFFIVASAFLAAAYATGLQANLPIVSIGVGVLGIIITLCFHLIEIRNRDLIRMGELALNVTEERMSLDTGVEEIRLMRSRLPGAPNARVSYRLVFRCLHGSTMMFYLFGVIYALWYA